MHTLIVYCHPFEGSFNHAVLEALCRRLEREGHDFEVIDLYDDGFDPALSRQELAFYNQGLPCDELVERYQRLVLSAEHLAIVCPIWWNDVPAMLRGWFDKVMLVGSTWDATGHGLVGKLSNLRDVDVYTTSASPTEETVEYLGDGIRKTLLDGTLWQLNVGGRFTDGRQGLGECGRWHNFGNMDGSTPEQRQAWLDGVEGL